MECCGGVCIFKSPPFEQAKLVRVVKGCVLDVAVDIRKDSQHSGNMFQQNCQMKQTTAFYSPPRIRARIFCTE